MNKACCDRKRIVNRTEKRTEKMEFPSVIYWKKL